jgi:hypothetical protein
VITQTAERPAPLGHQRSIWRPPLSTILLLEDDEMFAYATSKALEAAGHTVVTATTPW